MIDTTTRASEAHKGEMMHEYEVIESRRWQHANGCCASIYGAVPWVNSADRAHWLVVSVGWTVRNPLTGQVGIGRAPWATRDDAQAWADAHKPSRIAIGD